MSPPDGGAGVLYVVATPIGNLADMSERAVAVLRRVDRIAAEDTRHSAKLLQHFGVDTPMFALHDHNEEESVRQVLERLREGRDIALISDAGTPLISDPGYRLVREARAAGVRVVPIPGPSAITAALSAAGLATDRFAFEGFPPAKSAARRARLEGLAADSRTLVFFEAPHRILESLADMAEVFGGERFAVLARELSKTFETIHGDTLVGLQRWIREDANRQRGEFVVMVQGAPPRQDEVDEESARILGVLMEELPLKQAAALAAKITGGRKNVLYQHALALAQRKNASPSS